MQCVLTHRFTSCHHTPKRITHQRNKPPGCFLFGLPWLQHIGFARLFQLILRCEESMLISENLSGMHPLPVRVTRILYRYIIYFQTGDPCWPLLPTISGRRYDLSGSQPFVRSGEVEIVEPPWKNPLYRDGKWINSFSLIDPYLDPGSHMSSMILFKYILPGCLVYAWQFRIHQ